MENKPVPDEQTNLPADEEWDEEELEAAGQGVRLLNYVFDMMAVSLLTIAISTVLRLLGFEAWLLQVDNILLLSFSVIVAYYSIFEGLTSRTLGKFITGTYVVTDEGLKPGFGTILLRTLYRLIPLEWISFLFTPIGFHDLFSRTRVVKSQSVRGNNKEGEE